MMKLIKSIQDNYKLILGTLLIGMFLGWVFFHKSSDSVTEITHSEADGHNHVDEAATIWTCSMHPQIKMDKPGKCPICSMDLIPVASNSATNNDENDPTLLVLSESAANLAQIETVQVVKGKPINEVYLQGKVHADERNIAELTARFGGRIEKLFVNFTGQNVEEGEKLATIYSPDLITAQKELLEAITFKETRPALYKAARGKLKLWDLTDNQIDNIENSGQPELFFEILSPISGTVMMRHVALGDYVKEGDALFQVIDLKKVWVMFDAYESDLPWIRLNDVINFRVQALPGKNFTAKVNFIDPFINPKSRIAKVRVNIKNSKLELKPEMFANGIVKSDVANKSSEILIPKSSILWTGKRAIVYVQIPDTKSPSFKYREIVLGPEAGNFYVVAKGLQEGETIATNGVFKIDAASQLQGLPSMMNPGGGEGSTPHDMSKMNIDGNEKKMTDKEHKAMVKNEESKINSEFKKQLTNAYESYIKMKNAFVSTNNSDVSIYADELKLNINAADMKLLNDNNHLIWMNQKAELIKHLDKIINQEDISSQRFEFSQFNIIFHKTIKKFGLYNTTTFYQFCPMANSNAGAFWFSETKEIRNPYFGDAMLKCGEIVETFK